MITEEINIKKILPQEGYLLTNGDVITDVIFVGVDKPIEDWWEIPAEIEEEI